LLYDDLIWRVVLLTEYRMCVLFAYHRYRFTQPDDYNWFTKTLTRVILEEIGEESASVTEKTEYYVDFLR